MAHRRLFQTHHQCLHVRRTMALHPSSCLHYLAHEVKDVNLQLRCYNLAFQDRSSMTMTSKCSLCRCTASPRQRSRRLACFRNPSCHSSSRIQASIYHLSLEILCKCRACRYSTPTPFQRNLCSEFLPNHSNSNLLLHQLNLCNCQAYRAYQRLQAKRNDRYLSIRLWRMRGTRLCLRLLHQKAHQRIK